ncbi:hypothetical protein K3495_g5370 [Podosphaera aphanis]|nr:hypothetical protein K3495_g5370 [Podosphaera aphanis]
MASTHGQLGPVLVNFSKDGTFPLDEVTSASYPEKSAFSVAMKDISSAKSDLEAEIKIISQESAQDVDTWISHIKSIQEDIKISRKLAHSIVQDAEENELYLKELKLKQKYVSYMTNELDFNQNLLSILQEINKVYSQLVKVEEHVTDYQFTDAFRKFDDAFKSYQRALDNRKIQPIQVLELKFADLRKRTHQKLLNLWKMLVVVDLEHYTITINKDLSNENIGVNQIVTGLSYFGDIERISKELGDNLDNLIIKPRTSACKILPSIQVQEHSVKLGPVVDHSIQLLFAEIEELIKFLNRALPIDIIRPLSEVMMPQISERIFRGWLDLAVASSPDEMAEYEKTLAYVAEFATKMEYLQWREVDSFQDWVENAPKIWLNKRRETMLDWTRAQTSAGLGIPNIVEREETRIVQTNLKFDREKKGISTTDTEEWDAAWHNNEETTTESHINQSINKNNQQKKRNMSESSTPHLPLGDEFNLEDVDVDAWGWGDEEEEEGQEQEQDLYSETKQPGKNTLLDTELESPSLIEKSNSYQTEEKISEKYWITALPQSTLKAVIDIYEECVTLSSSHNQRNTVAATVPRLLHIPIQILAMYRAISPDCYAEHPAGNMYRYNDSMWLAKMLKDFATDWKKRTDIPQQLLGMNKLESDIPMIESFGKRAYRNELNEQRSAINDLLGGTRNFFSRDEMTTAQRKNEKNIQTVILNTRDLAALWEKVLPYSIWASAIGSIVNVAAMKLINDVFDLPDISVDEAERIATTISKLESLDDLFIQKGDSTDQTDIPLTAQFADNWMKMKFLSEVLQSNLKDIKFLWFESDLSLYFTVDEVVELIRLSFEMNYGAKQVIKEITEKPNPKPDDVLT